MTDKEFLTVNFELSLIQKKIKKEVQPIEQEWKSRINKDKWWASCNSLEYFKKSEEKVDLLSIEIRDRLLEFGGGEEVCLAFIDPDYNKMIEKGIFFPGTSKLMRGRPSQCHQNSCDLWENNKENTRICTGYALSKDGMWREHSWLIWNNNGVFKVIETTEKRVAYYGFIMTTGECKEFVGDNW